MGISRDAYVYICSREYFKPYSMKYLPFFLLMAFAGCKKNEPDFDILSGRIYKIEVEPITPLNRPVKVKVLFGGGVDLCAKADHLETSVTGNVITFTAFYKYPKNSPVCPLSIPGHELEYLFTPEAKGKYIFKSAEGNTVADIQVN